MSEKRLGPTTSSESGTRPSCDFVSLAMRLVSADGTEGLHFCHRLFWDSFRDHKG